MWFASTVWHTLINIVLEKGYCSLQRKFLCISRCTLITLNCADTQHSSDYAKRHAKLSALRPWTTACLKDLCLLLSLPRDGKKVMIISKSVFFPICGRNNQTCSPQADLVERIMQFLVQPSASDVKTVDPDSNCACGFFQCRFWFQYLHTT